MAVALEALLQYTSIMEHAEAVKQGVPNPYPADLMSLTEECVGDAARYIRLNRNRTVARLAQYGAPAQRTPMRPIDNQDVKLIHTVEELNANPVLTHQLRSLDSYEYNKGVEFLSVMTEDFLNRTQTLRLAVLGLLLANGRVGFDGGGNVLPDSSWSSAVEQVTWNVPAANQTQLNLNANGNVISSPWNNFNTDIPGQLRNLQTQMEQLNGYPPRIALCGLNVPSYIALNDYILPYMEREGRLRGDYLDMELAIAMRDGQGKDNNRATARPFMRLMNIDFYGVWTAFFDNDQTGVSPAPQAIWNADAVTFLPELDKRTWGLFLGSYPVPKSLSLSRDLMTAFDDVEIIHGMFGYGYLTYPPQAVSIGMVFGDTFFPTLKVQTAINQAIVKF